ncbi:Regulatory protein RecX [Marinomonas spartinae]|uniref:Regulatory protein RecX n=1 Tax=Marinomonas spartinae TaxID=1792290 RepID=A0A1A8TTU3_9GAMM|nr:recombination regulator RecX [Marinomonas spartinae]SBS37945.1 Regulatory protein RecX [Marinomonas spartinae]
MIKPSLSTMDHAMTILASRDHSTKEMAHKLKIKGHEEESIAKAIASLLEVNYLNDRRFAESYTRSRANKPLGPQRIKQELKQKGIKDDVISQVFEESDADWFELARELKQRKFGEEVTKDFKERAKQTRYLQYRGFGFEHIKYALEPNQD